jgi:hypothetical protein
MDLPLPQQLEGLTRRALQSLREVMAVPIMGQSAVMRQRLEASRYILDFARAVDPSQFAASPSETSRARDERIQSLQAQIEELSLEARRIDAEETLAAFKARPRML